MIPYDLLVTAVSERHDLFAQSMDSLLGSVDHNPARFVVHEDVRPGSEPGEIGRWLAEAKAQGRIVDYVHRVTAPAQGLGPAMRWCFDQAKTPIVFYTQDDWLFLRPVPVARCLDIMQHNGLHHVRFNKRKTMRAKHADTDHPWHKVEVQFLDSQGAQQTLCVSDHFYTQASLWRVDFVVAAIRANAEPHPQANAFVAMFNHAMNLAHADGRPLQDQQYRHQKLRTYIWGPIGEPPFIRHLGSVRTTGPIVHVAEMKGEQ